MSYQLGGKVCQLNHNVWRSSASRLHQKRTKRTIKIAFKLNLCRRFNCYEGLTFYLFSELRLCGNGKDLGCCCPICGVGLRTSELEAHYTQELEYLAKVSAELIVSREHRNNVSNIKFINST